MGCQHHDRIVVMHKGQERETSVVCDKEPAYTLNAEIGLYEGETSPKHFRSYGMSSVPLCEEHLDDGADMMKHQIADLKQYLDAQINGWGDEDEGDQE